MKQTRLSDAVQALGDALTALERALDPMLSSHAELKTRARESEGFADDRTRLAAELDEALEARRVREAEFDALSKQTRAELDATITALQQALGGQDDG